MYKKQNLPRKYIIAQVLH